MPTTALTFNQLLDWRDEETGKWRAFLERHPQALELPCDIAGTKSVRELLLHIMAVELRYAQRLQDLDVTPYEQLDTGSIASLFAIGDGASAMLRDFAAHASDDELQRVMEFPTRSAGTLRASKHKQLVHAVLHGMRHWAQLAVILRQQGIKTDWPHDYLMTGTMK